MSPRISSPIAGVPDHPAVKLGRTGVLLVNLGTPDSTEIPDIRRYLAQFLSDRRVIELNPILWKAILHGIILRTRPPKTAEAYRAIWREEGNESPLRYYTREEAAKLARRLDPAGETLVVDWAMRYGTPSVSARMEALQEQGCDRILIVPLYPQYSASTTGTVIDEVARELLKLRWQPAIRTQPAFHDDPAYIEAVATGIEQHLATLDWEPEVILASFHGLPKRYLMAGDPYHCHCAKTARLVRERLGLSETAFRLTFQSRFGREEWLQPYTDETIAALGEKEGVKRLAVVMPGFVADCVETLEEIAMQGRETFEEAGGTHFSAIPCLNDSDAAIDMLEALVTRELGGWWAKP
ncbi:ferrochelatase [Thalassobaculum sp. OXR-137]|uniref:ferrochelatase n=1 Tax=Thalassobaculum sp. OXR-137 TaxID=3100173 RepID=UPI002AC910C4|nr:ferrochelatase [Thalassobaculum sp. OXR-137]WPZ34699.1 ferrochelatase [Thalassobaculum sp. OXR-137]